MINIEERFESSRIMKAFKTVSNPSNFPEKTAQLDESISLLAAQFGLKLEDLRSEVQDIPHYQSIMESINFMGSLFDHNSKTNV